MSLLSRILFHVVKIVKPAAGETANTKAQSSLPFYLSVRTVLVFTVLATLMIVAMTSGAQELLLGESKSASTAASIRSAPKSDPKRFPNFDVRLSGMENIENISKNSLRGSAADFVQTAIRQRSDIDAGLARLRTEKPGAEIDLSPLTGAVEIVRSTEGLTGPAKELSGFEIVRDFITENNGLYGLNSDEIANLNFIGESISPESGLRMVRVEQIVNGRPVFQSETRFILDRDGQIIRSLGSMIPGSSEIASGLEDLLSPQDALRLTMEHFGVDLDTGKMEITADESDELKVTIKANDPNIAGRVTSKVVYFPVAPGVLVPAYSQIIFGTDADWYILVDARDGSKLWLKNIRSDASTHDARFRVYVQADGTTPADSPAPQSPSAAAPGAGTQFAGIAPTIVSMFAAQNITASPNGWIDDCPGGICTAAQTQTIGNNVLACLDRDGAGNDVCDAAVTGVLDGNGRPTGNADANARNRDFLGTTLRDFQTGFLPAPQGGNPEAGQSPTGPGASGTNVFDQFRRGSLTQQFYATNWYHDKLFALGFNPAAGNFQNNNFGGGGVGNDRVLIDVQDASGTNNANFSTPPDGTSGRSQMFIFTGPIIDRDGGLDTEILIHELTHGTSNRIVGNSTGLTWDIGRGLGEGWSDFYAMALLNSAASDNPNLNYASGAYATYKAFGVTTYVDNYVYGIRRFPYSTVNTVNPMTWADVDQTTNSLLGGIAPDPLGFNIGGAGEVHNTGELWALTLWEVRSRIIAANGGSVPVGNQISLQIVTDAMKLTPANPSFIQARDALINADCATNACANEESIWNGFADRGLGYGSRVPNRVSFVGVSPHIGVAESTLATNLDINTVAITDTIGNASGFIDPNESFRFEINLRNPWRSASKTATGVTATMSSSTPGVTILSPSTTYPNIAPNSNANRNSFNIVARSPAAAACGTSMNFTLTITSSLGTVARNFTLRLGAPSGTLAPVTYTRGTLGLPIVDNRPAGVGDTLNVTDDFEIADVNVRIDSITHTFPGDLTFSVKGPNGYGSDFLARLGGGVTGGGEGDNVTNMLLDDDAAAPGEILNATNAQAPYTGTWRPVFNSPVWTTLGFPAPDATPQLSNFDGSSSLGAWRANASDQFNLDAGVFQGWSLIITPRAFACTAFVPTAAGVSVSGRVVTGDGAGIRNAVVTITNGNGISRRVNTSSFGYYLISELPAGESYVMTVTSKRHQFASQVVTLTDNLSDLNFIAE